MQKKVARPGQFIYSLLFIMVLFFMSACEPNPAFLDTTQVPTEDSATAVPLVADPTETLVPPTKASPENTQSPIEDIPMPTSTEVMVEPTGTATEEPTVEPTVVIVKTELEATDPATVQLASGQVQLVEFFAFW